MRKMKRRQKKQLALLTVIIMIASIGAIMLLTPGFNIKKIEVYGNSALKDEEIISASGITGGINIFSASLKEAKDNLSAMGYVENVKIKRSLPSTVKITVVEEVGVAYLAAEDGYVIITADGRCVDITDGMSGEKGEKKTASIPNLPIVKGMKNVKYKVGKKITSEDGRQLQALTACLHEFAKYGYVFEMREIDVTNITDIKFYYRTKNLCVTVGSDEKVGYKMECFGPILKELGDNPKGYINLERLTYRKEESKPKPAKEEKTKEKQEEKLEEKKKTE